MEFARWTRPGPVRTCNPSYVRFMYLSPSGKSFQIFIGDSRSEMTSKLYLGHAKKATHLDNINLRQSWLNLRVLTSGDPWLCGDCFDTLVQLPKTYGSRVSHNFQHLLFLTRMMRES